MGRCRNPRSRIMLMRKKNLFGSYFQNIGGGRCAKSVGAFYDENRTPPAPPALILHDDFTDFDDVDLDAHTITPLRPGSVAWVNEFPTKFVLINSDRAFVAELIAALNYYSVDVGKRPREVSCVMAAEQHQFGQGHADLMIRAASTSSHFAVIVKISSTLESVTLIEDISTNHGSYIPTVPVITPALVTMTDDGGTITVDRAGDVESIPPINTTAKNTENKCGIALLANGAFAKNTLWDDFKVST